ncbi:hypothetical protein OS493_019858 [Desmophyllum pertusum]|uniref:Myosin motor domain-containing protein n=1 Tax=Desmophyllum pertusum TaxID=174260 RepID=A0A9W9YN39_9CNID|nr:hypothetical protein OS493_019858 [Desmophyllum pertusum]
MWAKAVGEHDMSTLRDISDETIAENLKQRLKGGIIYTYIGRVLIAVNPFKDLDLYGPDVLEIYCEEDKIDKLEREMSGITVALHRDRVSRCSTAKLPTFQPHRKFVENLHKHKEPKPPHIYALTNNMYHNMMIEKKTMEKVEQVKTVSSKHIMNCINKVSGMGSERIESRVVHLAPNERNFHVFYQILRGCTQEEKGHFGLQGKTEDYYYLNQSGVYTIDGKDDKKDYKATRVLLQCLARLLGVNKENLQEKLVSVITETRWGGRVEITKKTNNKDQENSFEQFVINYVNEKLQQVFVELTLKIEQEEYVREGISWEPVEFYNNKIVCELMENKRPLGIMAVLDDICSSLHTVTEKSEKTFMKKMKDIAGSNNDYSGLLHVHDEYFTINHYAGNVDYEAKSFCTKNKDELSNDMISLMQSSENPFVRDLFPETVYAGGKGQRNTGCAKMKCQTNGLIGKIMACTPHYVRCIKPSDSKAPLDWNQQRVIHQIAYLGLKECIAIRRSGFAIRRDFDCIVKRLGIIASETKQRWVGDRAEGCRLILRSAGFDSGKWKIGKTKLFLKEPDALHDLENIKNKHLGKFCVIIQKHYRRYRQMKQYNYMKQASEFQKNSFAPRIEWKRQRLGTLTFAEIVKETMDLKVATRRPNRGSFTTIIQTIFGLSGGGVHCKGISLEIQEGSLTTATRDVCLQLCNCKEEVAPIKTGNTS